MAALVIPYTGLSIPIPFLDNQQAQTLAVALVAAGVYMYGQQGLNAVVQRR